MIMKKLTIIGLLMLAFIGFNSCSEDDDLVFTTVAPEEGVVFVNTFLPEYILTPETLLGPVLILMFQLRLHMNYKNPLQDYLMMKTFL